MGIDPTIWGPHMWTMIHLISLQAPEKIDTNVRNTYYMFLSMMPYVLPCDKCREHWLEHIQINPLENALESRESLFRWSVNMHNIVNKSLGKKEISYEEAFQHWTEVSENKKYISIHNTKDKLCNFAMSKINYILILCMIIVVILLVIIVRKL